jgi:hypothetical protein
MDRTQRLARAAQVRQALDSIKTELKTASGTRRTALLEDMDAAMDDYMHFMDEGMWDEGMEDEPVLAEPAGILDDELDADFAPDALVEPMDHDEGMDALIEGMEEEFMVHAGKGDVPMGAMEEHSNIYAAEQENREHISYILDRVSEVVASIEAYEDRAVTAGRTPKSAGARARIAGYMKELASVVSASDLKVASTGKDLDGVGVKVMAMHKQLVKAG